MQSVRFSALTLSPNGPPSGSPAESSKLTWPGHTLKTKNFGHLYFGHCNFGQNLSAIYIGVLACVISLRNFGQTLVRNLNCPKFLVKCGQTGISKMSWSHHQTLGGFSVMFKPPLGIISSFINNFQLPEVFHRGGAYDMPGLS